MAGGWWLPQRDVEHETTNLKMASPCFSIKAALAGRPSPLVPFRIARRILDYLREPWRVDESGVHAIERVGHHGFVEVMWLCVFEFRSNCGSF